MQVLFRRANRMLLLSIIIRMIFFYLAAWILFKSTADSAITLLAFVAGGTILSLGVGVRINRPEPVRVENSSPAQAYPVRLSDQSSAVM